MFFFHSITIILYLFWSAWIVLEINLKHKITVYYQENLKRSIQSINLMMVGSEGSVDSGTVGETQGETDRL